MTRKDYIALAAALAKSKPNGDAQPYGAFLATVDNIADALAADNQRFDRKTFYAAVHGGR